MNRWPELASAACRDAGIEASRIRTLVTWDDEYCHNAVFQLDAHNYLKLFGPGAERQFHVEFATLKQLESVPAVPCPRIVASGTSSHGHPYLVLSPAGGNTAEEVWKNVPRPQQMKVARELGKIVEALHRLPVDVLAAVEQSHGGRNSRIVSIQGEARTREIIQAETLSLREKDELLAFIHDEAPIHLNAQSVVTHHELAHNHLYLVEEEEGWRVDAIIDWADAMIGPPEWDVVYLWHWTFTEATRDFEAMTACLNAMYANQPRPDRFARRCLAAVLYTESMTFLWSDFAAQRRADSTNDIVRELTGFLYPPVVFGSPD